MVSKIKVAGWQKVSLIDYPGKVACVIFLAGCNMRCHYCHNPQLFDATQNQLDFSEILTYLRNNVAMLDAVVVSGGEPTLHADLPEILRAIHALGLLVKLDTNGTAPAVVQSLIEAGLVDYVALDIKAPASKYVTITGLPINQVQVTLHYLKSQKRVPYVLRTTLTPKLDATDLVSMGEQLICGAPLWQIQQCRIDGAYSIEKVQKMVTLVEKYAQHIVLRNI